MAVCRCRAGEALARAEQLNLSAANGAAGWIADNAIEYERGLRPGRASQGGQRAKGTKKS